MGGRDRRGESPKQTPLTLWLSIEPDSGLLHDPETVTLVEVKSWIPNRLSYGDNPLDDF